MSDRHFGDYVAHLDRYSERTALALKPFIAVERTHYKALKTTVYKTAQYLLALGLTPGQRIMICAPNMPEWLELFLATQLIGVIAVPVDASANHATLSRFIKETAPTHLFAGPQLEHARFKDVPVTALEHLHTLTASAAVKKPDYTPDPQATSLIVFTSGTTAAPKGVALSQENILANVHGIQEKITIEPDWRLLSVLPLSHMYELTGSLAVLSRGGAIYYLTRVTPLAIARALNEYQITTILAIPQLLVLLLDRIRQTAAETGKSRLLSRSIWVAGVLPFRLRRLLFRSIHKRLGGHLDLIVTGGAPIPLDVARTWERFGVRMVQGYGLTETAPILTVNGPRERRLDSPGKALKNVLLRIGEENEIQAKGPSIFSGYWQNTAATHEVFTSDGWFKTSDTGSIKNGWLHIQGRLKFAIVLSSGLKVFPEDIEEVADLPVLKSLCVVGVKKAEGEAVEAVVIADGPDTEVQQAINEINARLESFQHISAWRRWPDDDFPRTRLLKVDRRSVQAWANQTNRETPDETKPTDSSHDPLIEIIRTVIREPAKVVTDNDRLADLGLDSLRRLSVVALIEEQLSVSVPEASVTQHTSVSELRSLIEHGSPAETVSERATWQFRPLFHFLGTVARDLLVANVVRIWVKLTVQGQENLQAVRGPALFIFNHTDDFDGPVVYCSLPRSIRKHLSIAAADDVLSEHRVLQFIAHFCYAAFNFSRHEPYRPSLEYVAHMIDRGWHVVLSPEGHISEDGQLQPFKTGIGLLAVNLNVPVIPIKTFGLRGTVPVHSHWPKKHSQVVVKIGPPLTFDSERDYHEVTKQLHDIMEAM